MVCRLAHAAIAFWCILQAIGEFEVSLKQRKGTLANLHSPQENQHPPSKGYIISLRDDTTHDEVTELRRELWQRTGRQGNVNDDPTKVEIWEVLTKGISITLDQQTLQWVRSLEITEYVEEEEEVEIATSEWHLDVIDGYIDNFCNISGDGTGIDVYILDSGIQYEHSEFGGRALFVGKDFTDPSGSGVDNGGHGTYVASLVAGKTFGVAKNATIYSVKIFNLSMKTTSGVVIQALNYIGQKIAQNPERRAIIVAAFAGKKALSINNQIERLSNLSVVVVTASGNKGLDSCLFSPASSESSISVGATDVNKNLWMYRYAIGDFVIFQEGSNIGSCVDIFAPGKRVRGALLNTRSGTSGAAAIVAGVIALMLQNNSTLGTSEVKRLLIESALNNEVDMSAGLLNLRRITPNRFLRVPDMPPATPPPEPVTEPPTQSLAERVRQQWLVEAEETENRSITVFYSSILMQEFTIILEFMRKENYTLESVTQINEETESYFFPVFKLLGEDEENEQTIHLNLSAKEAINVLHTSTAVTKIQYFNGYQTEGGHKYLIVESSKQHHFIAITGQRKEDVPKFKSALIRFRFTQSVKVKDYLTNTINSYYFSTSMPRNALFSYGNIHLSSLKIISHYLKTPVVHLSSYHRRGGQRRFVAIFDKSKTDWKPFRVFYGSHKSNSIKTDYIYPVLVCPASIAKENMKESEYFILSAQRQR